MCVRVCVVSAAAWVWTAVGSCGRGTIAHDNNKGFSGSWPQRDVWTTFYSDYLVPCLFITIYSQSSSGYETGNQIRCDCAAVSKGEKIEKQKKDVKRDAEEAGRSDSRLMLSIAREGHWLSTIVPSILSLLPAFCPLCTSHAPCP